MADRIFPNRFQEDPLDSDLVFQGIDWDNFNQRLAEASEPKKNKGLEKLIKSLDEDYVKELQGQKKASDDDDSDHKAGMGKEAKKGIPEGLKKWMEENGKGKKSKDSDDEDDEDHEDHEDHEDDEDDAKGPMKRK
jgi:hypothetical protein